jgi:hypothetical protein
MNKYYGTLEDIIEIYITSFKLFLFKVNRYRLWMHAHDPNGNVIEHVYGFVMINMRLLELVT